MAARPAFQAVACLTLFTQIIITGIIAGVAR